MSSTNEFATFASGCFWGTEYMFLKQFPINKKSGLIQTRAGFAVSAPGSADYAEAVQIEFSPTALTYSELVEFFYRSHDPTTLNFQGEDSGREYRSAIFTHSSEQSDIANRATAEIQQKYFEVDGKKIVTEIVPLGQWLEAEEEHQNFLVKHPNAYHCSTHILHW
ncbi:peptide methionine sulfoxide reductase [Mycena crocata]|nr:peptide methionine sulfoxide reductase [Mycena crocata]